jgi:flagellar basal body rod protein FlgB
MLPGILARATLVSPLKQSLDISAQRTKVIAGRVAQASANAAGGFALPAAGTPGGSPAAPGEPIDLEQEMVSLADEQLHFEAAAKLLEKAYAQLRLAIKDK